MNITDDIVLGIDVGGSHITLALVDLPNKKIISHSVFRAHINSWGTVDKIIDSWVSAVDKVREKSGVNINRVGFAMPGPFDYENGISYIRGNKKFDSLYGLNIKNLMAEKLGLQPENIRMLNDAAGFLQGEVFSGAAQNYTRAIGITLGTGLGSAVCVNGVAHDADLWNSPLKNSIAEEYISTRWFVKRYFELTRINILDVKALYSIVNESAMAKAVFREFSENLALFLKGFVADANPEVIIIGGNITKASPLFLPGLIKNLSQSNIGIPVRITQLGENAAILGAASCWQNDFENTLAQ
jgi:glucokinase